MVRGRPCIPQPSLPSSRRGPPPSGSAAVRDEDSHGGPGRALRAAPKTLITGRKKKCHFALPNFFSNLPGKSPAGAAGLVDDFPTVIERFAKKQEWVCCLIYRAELFLHST